MQNDNTLNQVSGTETLPEELLLLNEVNDDEMALSEHIEEFSQRLVFCLLALVTTTLACFADIRQIVKVFLQ